MNFSGNYLFDAPAQRVWDALMDPQAMSHCIPGCQGLTPDGEGRYRAILTGRMGPLRTRVNATITLTDLAPHQSYRLTIEAQGAMGSGSGEALVTLLEQSGQTTVQVDGEAQAGGAAGRMAQGMMEGAAQRMFQRFFDCLSQSVK